MINLFNSTLDLSKSDVILSVKDLSFGYTSKLILKDISFEIDAPSLVSIIGPNGVGKSTLIQCLNKLLTFSEGEVSYFGNNLRDLSLKDLSKFIGYVPCGSASSFPISVVDAVLMGRHPHAKFGSLDDDLKIVYDILDRLDISDLASRQLNELSAGQHQKVMLAKGLAQQPRVLLLDEPTANLDIKHQIKITRMMKDICHNDGITVVMICHDLNIAAKYSDRILMMSEGTIWADGTPEEVITESNLKKVYDVNSKVVFDEARPHIIVRDGEDSSSEKELLA